MKLRLVYSALIFVLVSCGNKDEKNMNTISDAFLHVNISDLDSEKKDFFKKINDDINLVRLGKKPKHAIFDKSTVPPLDGGTVYYVGKGYKLIIWKRMAMVSGIDGFFYGPEIYFGSENHGSISEVKFYSSDELGKLLDKQ